MNIKYIGRHASFTDLHLYKTGLTWQKDVTVHKITDELMARRFLKHKDSFVQVRDTQNADSTIVEAPKLSEAENEHETVLDSIKRMPIEALVGFAFANFAGYKLDNKLPVEEARKQVESMVNRFGVAGDEDGVQLKTRPTPAPDAALLDAELTIVDDTLTDNVGDAGDGSELEDDTPDAAPAPDVAAAARVVIIENEVVKLTEAGLTPGEIGKKLNITHQKVNAILQAKKQ